MNIGTKPPDPQLKIQGVYAPGETIGPITPNVYAETKLFPERADGISSGANRQVKRKK